MDLARTIGHVESFRVPRPLYNNDIMRWGEKNNSPRSYFIFPQLAMFTIGTFRACNRISRYVLLYFRQKTRRALAIRCFSLSPRNMIEFSTCALSRYTLLGQKSRQLFQNLKDSNKRRRREKIPRRRVGVLRTLRMSGVQGRRGKRNLGESSNNETRGNRVKWETYSLCRKKTIHIIYKEFNIYTHTYTRRRLSILYSYIL